MFEESGPVLYLDRGTYSQKRKRRDGWGHAAGDPVPTATPPVSYTFAWADFPALCSDLTAH